MYWQKNHSIDDDFSCQIKAESYFGYEDKSLAENWTLYIDGTSSSNVITSLKQEMKKSKV